MLCYLYEAPIFFKAPVYFLYASDLPPLLYYTHIPSAVLVLIIGLFVFLHSPKTLLNRLLFIIALCFSLWIVISLIAWTVVSSEVIMFVWPFFGVFAALMFIFSIYFVYVFLNKGQDISGKIKLILLVLLLPVLLLAHTNLSVSGFDLALCDAFGYEGLYFKLYYSFLGYIALIWTLILFFKSYKVSSPQFKKQIMYMSVGMGLFLLMFSTIIPYVTYLAGEGILKDSQYEWYALFGMVVFMTMVAVLIVKFNACRKCSCGCAYPSCWVSVYLCRHTNRCNSYLHYSCSYGHSRSDAY